MFVWIAVIIGSIFLDQLTKYLTIFYLKPMGTFPILEDILHLTYVENTGAAFGMMREPGQRWIFMSISVVGILALIGYMIFKKSSSKLENLALAFIIGGGIGNMIDRTALGYVVDMIDFRVINFAVFNVADSFVCVGAGLMALWMIRSMMDEVRAEKAAMAASDEVGEAASDEVVEEMTDVVTETDQADAEATVEVAEEVTDETFEETFEETSEETSKEDADD